MILKSSYNILICPLEWGLGHAGRMIPLARKLLGMDNKIFIGSGEDQLSLFRNELQGLSYIDFPGFKPRYSRIVPQYIILLLKIPALIYHIIKEHFRLKKIISDYEIDIVISDNRFGLWNRKVKTVYITHMPFIPFPRPFIFLEFIGRILHRSIIKKYNFCFIPDLPGELNISGRLSHGRKIPGNARYVGILSRFSGSDYSSSKSSDKLQQTVIILSGPEPQRNILKKKLTHILKATNNATVILEGRPDIKTEIVKSENTTYYNHLPAPEMRELLIRSERIISRSGYSTIMELISMNCRGLLIPTPGQTEQEYLAEYLSGKGWFTTVSQKELKPETLLFPNNNEWPEKITEKSEELLNEAIQDLLKE